MNGGWGSVQQRQQEDRERAEARAKQISRLWIKPGEEVIVTFLDDDKKPARMAYGERTYNVRLPYVYQEANVEINGKRHNHFTKPKEPCAIAADEFKDCVAFTVIDHRRVEKNGKFFGLERRLLVMRTYFAALSMLQEYAQTRAGGLRGLTVKLKRSLKENTPSVGDQVIKLDDFYPTIPAKLTSHNGIEYETQPFNYLQELAPLTPEQIDAALGLNRAPFDYQPRTQQPTNTQPAAPQHPTKQQQQPRNSSASNHTQPTIVADQIDDLDGIPF